ncbi:uncharacterized protein [Halyomorpha halys]|uniref:uncharacterized protein n=1 Tax=Halyomorpha halys TaxID=286706 RepID=UPI0006D50552|nr:uncharacterized protein LOC106689431 [Halyomorpha halys]
MVKGGNEWNKDIIEKLICLYRERPCLWKLNHEHYTNKAVKYRMYSEIVDALRDDLPEVDHISVKNKIQNLRSSYRKEIKKVEASLRNGRDEEIYEPSLWYFNLINFTRDQDRPLPSLSNLDDTNFDSCNEGMEEEPEQCIKVEKKAKFFKTPQPKKPRNELGKDLSSFIKSCTAVLSTPSTSTDDCDAFGNYIAEKLRKMDDNQQILAEALIQKIITKGLKKQLTDLTDFSEQISQYQHLVEQRNNNISPCVSHSQGSSISSAGTEYCKNTNN